MTETLTFKSGFTGVCWHARDKKWMAYICKDNKRIIQGNFSELKDAVKARNEVARRLHGEFAVLNDI